MVVSQISPHSLSSNSVKFNSSLLCEAFSSTLPSGNPSFLWFSIPFISAQHNWPIPLIFIVSCPHTNYKLLEVRDQACGKYLGSVIDFSEECHPESLWHLGKWHGHSVLYKILSLKIFHLILTMTLWHRYFLFVIKTRKERLRDIKWQCQSWRPGQLIPNPICSTSMLGCFLKQW